MSPALPQYLRTYRKRAGFAQRDIAALLGLKSDESVSRYEHLARRPTLETVFGYQVIFNVLPHDLLPGLYREVEQGVQRRARDILQQLGPSERRTEARKWAVYDALASAPSQ